MIRFAWHIFGAICCGYYTYWFWSRARLSSEFIQAPYAWKVGLDVIGILMIANVVMDSVNKALGALLK